MNVRKILTFDVNFVSAAVRVTEELHCHAHLTHSLIYTRGWKVNGQRNKLDLYIYTVICATYFPAMQPMHMIVIPQALIYLFVYLLNENTERKLLSLFLELHAGCMWQRIQNLELHNKNPYICHNSVNTVLQKCK